MRSWGIMLAGASLGLGLTTPALASGSGAVLSRPAHGMVRNGAVVHRWGPQVRGRWFAGWWAPGGWAGYRRPTVGYVLPSYWLSPAYRIGNYGAVGLPAPAPGYGWSRYYDDAVMVDRDGRVRDHREAVDWARHDGPPPPLMGYDDDVTAPEGPPPPMRDDHDHGARPGYGVDYDAPPYHARLPYDGPPPIVHHDGPGAPIVTTTQAPGYYAGGYYYPGATTTTVVVQPTVTTTRTYVTETVSRPRRHKGK